MWHETRIQGSGRGMQLSTQDGVNEAALSRSF